MGLEDETAAAVKKPNKWLAGALALFFSPYTGMLYAAKPGWALVYFVGLTAAAVAFLWSGGASVYGYFLALITLSGVAQAVLAAARYPEGLRRPIYSRWYGLLGILFVLYTLVFLGRAFLFEPFRVASGSMLPTLEIGTYVVTSKWGYGNSAAFGITVREGAVSAPVRRGDVMVFVYPASDERLEYLMRVVGLPGDLVAYNGKSLSINGQAAVYRDLGTYDYWGYAGSRVSTNLRSEMIGTAAYRVLNTPDTPAVHAGHIQDFPGKGHCTYHDGGFACRVPAKHYFMLGDNRDASNDSRYWGFVPEDHVVGKVINFQ